MLIQVSRHGYRSPDIVYPFTENEEDNFETTWDLTEHGRRQQGDMGRWLREIYVGQEKLVSYTYDSSETYVQTTDLERTLESAKEQLQAMYPYDEGAWPIGTDGSTTNHHYGKGHNPSEATAP